MRAAGIATFVTSRDGTIAWSEEGTLYLADGPVAVAAHRVLRRDAGGSWAVEFADGRPFHPWRTAQEVEHPCAPDTYRGRIDVDGDDWRTVWHSAGPAKDYTITTGYARASAL